MAALRDSLRDPPPPRPIYDVLKVALEDGVPVLDDGDGRGRYVYATDVFPRKGPI